MARTMEALQNGTDSGTEQQSLLEKTGQLLATVVGNKLSTASTETEIERFRLGRGARISALNQCHGEKRSSEAQLTSP